jgi:hypothetical protein
MITKIVGFDIRIIDRELLAADWDATRRDTYLLQPDVTWVGSVDPVVWPSIFSFENGPQSERRYQAIRTTPQDARQQAFGLWRDQRSMLDAGSKWHSSVNILAMPVAICLISEHIPSAEHPWAEVFSEPTRPEAMEDSWRLLGFDVADRFLMSGLSNCGYTQTEKETLSGTWSMKLNGIGLIKELKDATKFREITDHRVQEHSPFLVFGLYELDARRAT